MRKKCEEEQLTIEKKSKSVDNWLCVVVVVALRVRI